MTPLEAANRTTLRPVPRFPHDLTGYPVVANLHPWQPGQLAAAVFDTSHRDWTGERDENGARIFRPVPEWTVVAAAPDPTHPRRVRWYVGTYRLETP